ncbi:uncharacterized protein RCO7_14041 [Rhynchosporium graminicola]|uniref:Uncharacterized protein n=1 Tax=Rhynchosporium graminicola TaxID=2792576 RepID=A0A1E1L3N0_9HELO|nr:uncharacterized protein RCO7_14041 [Rhynchosporium commune]
MPDQYPNERQYAQDALNREMMWTVASVFGVSREPEQDMWKREQGESHHSVNQASWTSRSYSENSQRSEDVVYRVAHVFDRKHGKTKEVTVMEDSCFEVVAPVTHATLKGSFESNQRDEINWYGQKGKGNSRFYVAPIDAPIQLELLVGMAFQYEYPNVFGLPALPGLALLNVQTKVKEGEGSQIQSDQMNADAQAADLAREMRAKKEKRQKDKQKQTNSSSSTKSRLSKK